METEVLAASERTEEVSKEGSTSNIGALDMMWQMRFMNLEESHGGDTPLNDSGVRYSTVE